MQALEIFERLKAEFGDSIIELQGASPSDQAVIVKPEEIKEISLFLRDSQDLYFDYLSCLSGMHYKDGSFGVVYHLFSLKHKHRIVIKALLPAENPALPTVEDVWLSADWHEREAWDMYGIVFEGHHNLIRILCPYDWEGFPLRKDYVQPEEYHGMKIS